jgi:hypothetical protein
MSDRDEPDRRLLGGYASLCYLAMALSILVRDVERDFLKMGIARLGIGGVG